MFIEVDWVTERDPEEEEDYIVTTEKKVSENPPIWRRDLNIAHYSTTEEWNRKIVAWTNAWIEQYTEDYK